MRWDGGKATKFVLYGPIKPDWTKNVIDMNRWLDGDILVFQVSKREHFPKQAGELVWDPDAKFAAIVMDGWDRMESIGASGPQSALRVFEKLGFI